MKQAMREHFRLCGRVEGFLNTYAQLRTGQQNRNAALALWYYCDPCPFNKADGLPFSDLSESCADRCELGALFIAGWQDGQAQAELAFETEDLALFEDIGRVAGVTSRRPPRNDKRITPQLDGVNGNLEGDALRRFIRGWRQTGRRTKGI